MRLPPWRRVRDLRQSGEASVDADARPARHFPNAISLNAIMFQTASVVGPALGGVVIGEAGVGGRMRQRAVVRFVIVALLMMRDISGLPRAPRDACPGSGARGSAICLRDAAHSIDDAARFLRDVLFVGHGAAADLRAGHPARRPARLRLAVAAPSVGAVYQPGDVRLVDRIERRGPVLLWAMAVFGLATVVLASRDRSG